MSDLQALKATVRIAVAPNCELRPLRETDVTTEYVDGLNDPAVNQHLVGSRSRAQTMESVQAYVGSNERSASDVLFGVYIDRALRGTVRLHDVDPAEGTARVGVLIFDRQYWNRGWASRAIAATIRFASAELGIPRFWAGMRATNAGSRRTFEGLGFRYQPDRDWVDPDGGLHHFFLLDSRG